MESINTGVNEQEAADPVDTEIEESVDTGVNDAAVAEQQTEEPKTPKTEENAIAAAARRRAEAEYSAKLKAETERANRFAKTMGYETFEEMERSSGERALTEAGLNADAIRPFIEAEFQRMIENHPDVKAARLLANETVIEKDMREFLAAYPDAGIKDVSDFPKMDNYDQFAEYVAKGLNYADAYTLTNAGQIKQKAASAAKQSALNSVHSKDHLKSSNATAATAKTRPVPADTREQYRKFFPDWTDEQISKHYNASRKDE